MALVHIVLALGAWFGFGFLVLYIVAWEQERAQKRRLQDAAIELGVPVAALETDEALTQRMFEYSSKRFSGELLRNRLSDFCDIVRAVWLWGGALIQFGIVGLVCWGMYESGRESAVYMWAVPATAVFFWVVSVVFSFACKLLTGRYPGEAKAGRRALAAYIESNRTEMPHAGPAHQAAAWES